MSNMTAEIPREKLKELVEKNGDGLLQDPDRCEGLLKDHCGSHRREISALVGALEERIPLELKSSWQAAMTPEAMRARLVQRLEENRGLAPEVANWAVDAWSYALGVGLGRRSDRVVNVGTVVGPSGAEGSTWGAGGTGPSVAERIASDRPGGASVVEMPSGEKRFSVAQMSSPKKAGFGAVAALVLGVGAFALMHHPTPTPPTPVPVPNPAPAPVVNPNPKRDDPKARAGVGDGGTVDNRPPVHDTPKFLPAGTIVSVRVDRAINSDELNVGDIVDATVSTPVTVDGNVIVTTGAQAELKVTAVEHAAKDGGAAHLQLALVDLSTEQGRVQVTASPHQFDGPTVHAEQAKRGGIGAAAGAVGGFVVGKIFHHGGAGAAAGAGGGAVAGVVTAKAQPVKIAAETPIHFRLSATVRAPAPTTAKK
jgi:hypothetical protein